MTDRDENLSPATTEDVADALAFALRFHGRKRVNSAYEYMAQITAERLCEGFTVLRGRNIFYGDAISIAFTGTQYQLHICDK